MLVLSPIELLTCNDDSTDYGAKFICGWPQEWRSEGSDLGLCSCMVG